MFYFLQRENGIKITCLLHILKINIKKLLVYFCIKPLQSVFFTCGALNSNTNFSTEILDLYLASVNFTERKVDSHTHAAPNILKHCPTVESVTGVHKYVME